MPTLEHALGPLATALVEAAEQDAAATIAEAADHAARVTAEAHQRAKEILDEARAEGEAEARAQLAATLAVARRSARAIELRTRRQVYDTVRQRVHESLADVRTDALRAALTTHALAVLGPGTVVRDVPDGGVVAYASGRYMDLSLTTLADRAFDRVAPELGELWAR
ncbi:hypothetical protein GCM10029964_086470 [Kibdelosporangium lantanae]